MTTIADCTCDHSPHEHDDGFGCTVPDCPCLARWQHLGLTAEEDR